MSLSKPIQDYTITTNNWMVISLFLLGLIDVFDLKWYINELSAVFLMIAVLCGMISKIGATAISETVLKAVSVAAPGAFLVGYATSIKVLMEMGNIGDTISFNFALMLQDLPLYTSAISMSVSQSINNFFIPSGSGQAFATLPIMLPLGESLELTRQITILAFQIGDGLSNLVNPTLGGLIAMLSMCRVPIDRWVRFIFPVLITLFVIASIALIIAVATNYS